MIHVWLTSHCSCSLQQCMQDLMDGYFPSELQERFPDGVPFEVWMRACACVCDCRTLNKCLSIEVYFVVNRILQYINRYIIWSVCRFMTGERRSLLSGARGLSFPERGTLFVGPQRQNNHQTLPPLKYLVYSLGITLLFLLIANVVQILKTKRGRKSSCNLSDWPQARSWTWISFWTGCQRCWLKLVEWLTSGTQ